MISYQARNEIGGFELPIWFAPRMASVSRRCLLPSTALPPASGEYRYPGGAVVWDVSCFYWRQTSLWLVTELVGAAPKVHQGLGWIVSLQNMFDNLPSIFSNTVLLTDLLAKPWAFIVILPLIAWHFGRNFALKFGFTLISSDTADFDSAPRVWFPTSTLASPNIEISDEQWL